MSTQPSAAKKLKKQKRVKKRHFHKLCPRDIWICLAVEGLAQQLFHDKQQNAQSQSESTRVFQTRRMCDNKQLRWGIAKECTRLVNEASSMKGMRTALGEAAMHESMWTEDGVDGTFARGKDEVQVKAAIER